LTDSYRETQTWPLTKASDVWAWPGSRDPVNFWVLNANSTKMAKVTNF